MVWKRSLGAVGVIALIAVLGFFLVVPFAIAVDEKRRYYTTMFHPEVVHTPDGARLLRNFVIDICGCHGKWSMASFREEAIHRIKRQVGFDGTLQEFFASLRAALGRGRKPARRR